MDTESQVYVAPEAAFETEVHAEQLPAAPSLQKPDAQAAVVVGVGAAVGDGVELNPPLTN